MSEEKQEKKISKHSISKAIRHYKSPNAYDTRINLHYKKHKSCEGLDKKDKEVCDILYRFLSENTLEEDAIVYRGVSNSLPLREYIASKDGQPSNIFLSTSKSKLIAKNFADNYSKRSGENPYIFKITLPKGTHAVDVDSRSDAVSNVHEQETIVLPGGVLRFTGEIEEYEDIPLIHFIYDSSDKAFIPRRKRSAKKKNKKSVKKNKKSVTKNIKRKK